MRLLNKLCRFLLRKVLITTFKCGNENRLENLLSEAPTNYYKKLAWILADSKKFYKKTLESRTTLKNTDYNMENYMELYSDFCKSKIQASD
ncbi:glycine, alanine and asparagine-rich protein-like [Gossypium australe]|uniref:Glycine, alanine and asparagine-rich protein-like n=1 Tax=Gossypium australe TaxID=47621 RepID=A0A5B6UHA5_9ROSI|nr:glycine, alanine and asparagine-rich protein-like [Gossypium australe]